jgi:hypothetical protein
MRVQLGKVPFMLRVLKRWFLADRPQAVRRYRQLPLTFEQLENRTLLSTSIPLDPFKWTELGPKPIVRSSLGLESGRIWGGSSHPSDPNIFYIASHGGGIWKSTDGGSHWMPLTDDLHTLSFRSVALAPSNVDVVYAGTSGGGVHATTGLGPSWYIRRMRIPSTCVPYAWQAAVRSGRRRTGERHGRIRRRTFLSRASRSPIW